jgi:hypothetical protein
MLSKESKIRVLENFYAVDYILFGKPASKVDTCCPIVREEYLAIKGALLSVYVEMLRLVDHNPDPLTETVDKSVMISNARRSAMIARENSQKIVTTEKARQNIKENLKNELKENANANISALVEKQIRMKAFGLAIDNLLIARTLQEGECENLNTWEGKIIEDSYKILRDNLIESAYMMIHSEDEALEEVDWKRAGKTAGLYGAFAAGGAAVGVASGLAYAKYKCRHIKEPEKKKQCFKDILARKNQSESEDLTEWGQSPQEQMKDAQQEKKEDMMEIRRKCMKYRNLGQPAKEKACLETEMRKHNEHWNKVFAGIKRDIAKQKMR